MHVLVFQHVPFEDLGAMAPWLNERKAQVQVIRQYEPDSCLFPALSAIDLIIVLGGPISVHDTDQYPWLEAEKAYIQSALHAKTPILGLCLGAQLIAEQLGGTVRKNLLPEIGWWPIHWHATAQHIWPECQCAVGPELEAIEAAGTRVFHWHGETFDLPAEAQLLAHSDACVNQGFLYRDHVVGLQIHLEMTPETVEHLLADGEEELVDSPFVSTAEKMKSEPVDTYALNQRLMGELLQYLVASRCL